MEALLRSLEATPNSEEATFLLVRAMSRREPRFSLRFGAFFDPLDQRPKGGAQVNALYAYEEYERAGDAPEARERRQALANWLATPSSQGVAGAAELKAKLGP